MFTVYNTYLYFLLYQSNHEKNKSLPILISISGKFVQLKCPQHRKSAKKIQTCKCATDNPVSFKQAKVLPIIQYHSNKQLCPD